VFHQRNDSEVGKCTHKTAEEVGKRHVSFSGVHGVLLLRCAVTAYIASHNSLLIRSNMHEAEAEPEATLPLTARLDSAICSSPRGFPFLQYFHSR
jgi:hypothetical protein